MSQVAVAGTVVAMTTTDQTSIRELLHTNHSADTACACDQQSAAVASHLAAITARHAADIVQTRADALSAYDYRYRATK